jgi:hypothetical protein
MTKKTRREVRNLILMLSSAVFVAFIAVVGAVYYLGASGTYRLRDVLASPRTLENISFADSKSTASGRESFVFNKIEFVSADMHGRNWGRFAVSLESYAAFYDRVSHERSVPIVTEDMIAQFSRIVPSTLTIFVTEKGYENIFQQVQFIDGGDFFRVQLRSFAQPGEWSEMWIYFLHPGIYKEITELFAPTLIQP